MSVYEAISTLGPLQCDVGTLKTMSRHEFDIELTALFLQHSGDHFNTSSTQTSHSPSGHFLKRVKTAHHNFRYAYGHYHVGTRGCLPEMRARLERDIHGGLPEQCLITDRSHGIDFGMSLTAATVPAFAYYISVRPHYHRSHHRVRRSVETTVGCQLERPAHVSLINFHTLRLPCQPSRHSP